MADVKIDKPPADPPPSYETAAAAAVAAPSSPKPPPPLRAPLPFELPLLSLLREKRVILASASPRRKQLLGQVWLLGVFPICCSMLDEWFMPPEKTERFLEMKKGQKTKTRKGQTRNDH